MRFFLELAYRGTDFHGWQIQENALSVQAVVEEALSTILRKPAAITASGRTDTGVHAIQQFVHLDSDGPLHNDFHGYKLNALLPPSVVVKNIYHVRNDAHARFHALSRSYEYHISFVKNPFRQGLVYFYNATLNFEEMNRAAEILLYYENFQSFSRVRTGVKTFDCNITHARWEPLSDGAVFNITANRFLRGMVRAIVGTLLEVGRGNFTVDQFTEIIEGRNRKLAGRAVPPDGLFLSRVKYPEEVFLPLE